MRKNNASRMIKSIVLMAPLLAAVACDSSGTSGGGNGLTIPTCQNGEALTTDSSGALQCKALPAGQVVVPTCDATTQALTSDGTTLSCAVRNVGGADATAVNTTLDQYNNQLITYKGMLDNAPHGAAPVFVGATDVQPSAQIKRTGSETGLNAANGLCSDKYAGSHMCNVTEMYNSVNAGQFKMADVSATKRYWILFPALNEPIGTPHGPSAGYADNCGSMSYPTHDKAWTGIQVAWELLETGSAGFSFYGGDLAKCSDSTRALACCK